MTVTAKIGRVVSARFKHLITTSEEYTVSGFKSEAHARKEASARGCQVIGTKWIDQWKFMSKADAISKGLEYHCL